MHESSLDAAAMSAPNGALLDRAGRVLRTLGEWSAYTAAAVLALCVAMTTTDILLRNLFNSGITGIVDLTQLTLLWAAFLSVPMGFVLDNHISVELIYDHLPPRSRAVLRLLGSAAAVAFLSACAWWGWEQAHMELVSGDTSQLIGIPMILYWVPLIYGMLLSAACALLTGVRAAVDVLHGTGGDLAGGGAA